MSKPDDVSQWAWDAATRLVGEIAHTDTYESSSLEAEEDAHTNAILIARAMMGSASAARSNFHLMQNAAAELLKRAERAEEALAFVHRWTWEKEGNGTSDAERLSAIKHHPAVAATAIRTRSA